MISAYFLTTVLLLFHIHLYVKQLPPPIIVHYMLSEQLTVTIKVN